MRPAPDEDLLQSINAEYPCRNTTIDQLARLLWPTLPGPGNLVVHGSPATGKSSIVRAVLHTLQTPHVIVPSKECITARQLFERTVAGVEEAVVGGGGGGWDAGAGADRGRRSWSGRCENVSALAVCLQRLLATTRAGDDDSGPARFVVVFDGVDGQREAGPSLLPGLARLAETMPALTTVFILTTPRAGLFHLPGLAHVHFPAYTAAEATTIVARSPRSIVAAAAAVDEDSVWLWTRFIRLVYDSLGRFAGHDLPTFRQTCDRLWPRFVQPIVDGVYGRREFAKLVVGQRQRGLFASEEVLVHRIVARGGERAQPTTTNRKRTRTRTRGDGDDDDNNDVDDLPRSARILLCAAYLASYLPAKHDALVFMKSSETTRTRRRRRATKTRPSTTTTTAATQRRKLHHQHLLGPQPFALDRLLAIFHALAPHADPPPTAGTAAATATVTADHLYPQIATLLTLRLLLAPHQLASASATATSTSTSGTAAPAAAAAAADALDPLDGHQARYRVNVGAEYAARLARTLGLELQDYLAVVGWEAGVVA
ncbi:MAG: hypothetical protein M1826_002184 [Phylliscum demangeonii]|nr:MAG: hypothetical protein M1826_002184 [Phylliscum demangeonii]